MPLIAVSFLLAACLFVNVCRAEESVSAKLHPVHIEQYDIIATPGSRVWLQARLATQGFLSSRKGIPNLRVVFRDRYTELGIGRTDSGGVVSILHEISDAPGVLEYSIEFEGNDRHAPAKATGLLYNYDPARPLLVCQIDGITIGVPEKNFMTADLEKTPPIPGASVALQMLNNQFNIIYFTRGGQDFIQRFHEWVLVKAIPPGPVFSQEKGIVPFLPKMSGPIISQLKKKFPRVRAGICSRPDDARMFLKMGLQTIVISQDTRLSLPEGAQVISEWPAAAPLLKSD